jgi:hypothetical protein
MSVYVLGPAIESVTEPEPDVAPTPPEMVGRIGIKFDDGKPTEPGGVVNFQLLASTVPSDLRPEHVHAVYTNPPDKVPTDGQRTAEWFMNSGSPRGSLAIPQPPADATGTFSIKVAGVTAGIWHVQTIMEYSK